MYQESRTEENGLVILCVLAVSAVSGQLSTEVFSVSPTSDVVTSHASTGRSNPSSSPILPTSASSPSTIQISSNSPPTNPTSTNSPSIMTTASNSPTTIINSSNAPPTILTTPISNGTIPTSPNSSSTIPITSNTFPTNYTEPSGNGTTAGSTTEKPRKGLAGWAIALIVICVVVAVVVIGLIVYNIMKTRSPVGNAQYNSTTKEVNFSGEEGYPNSAFK